MPKRVTATMIVALDDDRSGEKAEALRAKLVNQTLKRKDENGNVVADIKIEAQR